MSEAGAVPCPTCGTAIQNRFCGVCGEKRVTADDFSITHFAGHVVESLTSFDFKTLRAFLTLVRRPGLLTRDYLDGRRRGYLGPIQLFLIVNIAFALSGSISFRTPLAVQQHDPPFPAFKRSLIAGAIERRAVSPEEFRHSFDDAAELQAKTWVFAMIPLFALVTAALYGFRRYLFEQLIFATHILAFLLTWMLVIRLLLLATQRVAGVELSAPDRDTVSSIATLAGFAVYLVPAFRRAFGDGGASATARALAVTVLLYPIVLVYRFLLFFVTLQTMH
jgi:hypothetical protein